jgi:ketosteroid isomerase-like protein
MTAQNTTKTLDFGALKGAIERRDPDALLGFYADDAELRVENAALPDGKAFELRGRAQIERYLRAVCDQEMACAVRGEAVFGERSVAFVEACRYGDGSAISVETVLEVTGGRIVRHIDVVARASQDEGSEG